MASENSSDIGLVTTDSNLITRVQEIAKEFGYSYKNFSGLDEFLEFQGEIHLIIAFVKDEKNPKIAAEMAQAARHVCAQSYLICGVEKSLPKEAAVFAKK